MKAFEQWPELMTVHDVAECTGLPVRTVYSIFRNKDFPKIGGERYRAVGKFVLREYLNKGVKINE